MGMFDRFRKKPDEPQAQEPRAESPPSPETPPADKPEPEIRTYQVGDVGLVLSTTHQGKYMNVRADNPSENVPAVFNLICEILDEGEYNYRANRSGPQMSLSLQEIQLRAGKLLPPLTASAVQAACESLQTRFPDQQSLENHAKAQKTIRQDVGEMKAQQREMTEMTPYVLAAVEYANQKYADKNYIDGEPLLDKDKDREALAELMIKYKHRWERARRQRRGGDTEQGRG